MILDLIVGLAAAIWELALLCIEVLVWTTCTLVWFAARLIGRSFEKPKFRGRRRDFSSQAPLGTRPVLVIPLAGLALAVLAFGFHRATTRQIEVRAADGLPVPFAAFQLLSSSGVREVKTKFNGDLHLPRFGWTNLHLVDLRYVETNWPKSNLPKALTIHRSPASIATDRAILEFLKKTFVTNPVQPEPTPTKRTMP